MSAVASNPTPSPTNPLPLISVVIPAWNEGKNMRPLIERLWATLRKITPNSEIIIVDGGSSDETWSEAEAAGARCILQRRVGYGGALREGFLAARGDFIFTMDSDLSHPPELMEELWKHRDESDIVVASRFVGGSSQAPFGRKMLSILLNWIFQTFLAVPIKDSSSGYRLYHRRVLEPRKYTRENFNILQEVIVRGYAAGFSVSEIPLHYEPRAHGESHVSLVKFALSYLPTLYRLWLLRNTTEAADYESRAAKSRHLLQRYWVGKRTSLIRSFIAGVGPVADLGCGSAPHLAEEGSVISLDICRPKLRFQRSVGRATVESKVEKLPFRSGTLNRALLSQVLPYVSDVRATLQEANRILSAKGILVLAVADSKRLSWRIIRSLYRLLPNVKDLTETQELSRTQLIDMLAESGFRVTKYRYILGAELVLRAQKVAEDTQSK